jgi:hypothetical protein
MMRTFQALHAKALSDAVAANQAGDVQASRRFSDAAAEWNRLDQDALRRAREGKTGQHRA